MDTKNKITFLFKKKNIIYKNLKPTITLFWINSLFTRLKNRKHLKNYKKRRKTHKFNIFRYLVFIWTKGTRQKKFKKKFKKITNRNQSHSFTKINYFTTNSIIKNNKLFKNYNNALENINVNNLHYLKI